MNKTTTRRTTVHRWLRFAAGLSLILLFSFGAVPALQLLRPVSDVRSAIESSGVDATALFYTESDVSSEAESSLVNAARFSPASKAPD